MKKKINNIEFQLEIFFCLEKQFYPKTASILMIGVYAKYNNWIHEVLRESLVICKREKLI